MATVDKLLKLLNSKNIAQDLEEEDRNEIARSAIRGYQIDNDTRKYWLETNTNAMKMIKNEEDILKGSEKDFPFVGAARVTHPLLISAIIHLGARLSQQIVRNDSVVECAALGKDQPEIDPQTQKPTGFGVKEQKAKRVGEFLSYECLLESETWLPDQFKMQQIVAGWGTAFKEVYYNPITKKVCSELLAPEDVIINHNVSCLKEARRITIRQYLTKNDIIEKQRSNQFLDLDLSILDTNSLDNPDRENDGEEKQPVYEFLKQYTYLDLDDDNYDEPYCIWIHNQSETLFGIYPSFDMDTVQINKKGQVLGIERILNLVDQHCIHDPDGKYYSLGLNNLLYHHNKAITAIMRQLLDAGTLRNIAGSTGFVTRAFKTTEHDLKFQFGQYNVVDVPPQVRIQDQITNMPFAEPSQVLLALLQLLIESGKETGFMQDVLTGDTEMQNVPATTMLAAVEQGTRAFKPIIQNLYQSEKKEFTLRFKLHAKYLDETKYFKFQDQDVQIVKDDFDIKSLDIVPVADPTMASEGHKYARLQFVMQLLQTLGPMAPSAVNIPQILQLMFSDVEFPNPEMLINPPPPPQPNPAVMKLQQDQQQNQQTNQINVMKQQLAAMKLDLEKYKLDIKKHETVARIHEGMVKGSKLVADATKDTADTAIAQHHEVINQSKVEAERERNRILETHSGNSNDPQAS